MAEQVNEKLLAGHAVSHQARRRVHFQGVRKGESAGRKELIAGLQEMPERLAAGLGLRAVEHFRIRTGSSVVRAATAMPVHT